MNKFPNSSYFHHIIIFSSCVPEHFNQDMVHFQILFFLFGMVEIYLLRTVKLLK